MFARTSSEAHVIKAAPKAGKHVYCEWPLGRTTAAAVELAALAKVTSGRTASALSFLVVQTAVKSTSALACTAGK